MEKLLEESKFKKWKWYRYYSDEGELFSEEIDHKKGYVLRTRENAPGHLDMSLVVDLLK